MGQAADGIAQAVNDFVECLEYFIMEASGSKFFPNLFNRIHFWCVWRNEHQFNIWKQLQGA